MSSKGGGGGGMGGMNTVTTVMAFSVSACFVLFVFTRLLCARLHLRPGPDQPYNVERGIGGLEQSVVTTFPTVKFGDGPRRPPVQEESQCAVCLEEYAAKEAVRVLPACGHAFHAPCIDAWLRQHPTCPVCRAPLRAARNHRATPLHLARDPASTSSVLSASPQAAAEQAGTGPPGRLEIVSEQPASSGDQAASSASEHR